MVWDLKSKTVLITGGANGIGFEIADRYLQKGAKLVVLLDIAETEGLEASKNLNAKYGKNKAVFMKCDVTKDLDAISSEIIDTYKTVDVLVNSAGIFNDQRPKLTIDINLQALIDWSLRFWQHMRTDEGGKGGTIINIASIMGFRVSQYIPTYQASKFAFLGFTKSLGHIYNFNRSGVRVFAICPGFTYTKLIENVNIWDSEKINDDLAAYMEKQVFQKPESVGRAAADAYESAGSGTAWLIEGDQPIVEVQHYAEMGER